MEETDAESFDRFIERHWGNNKRTNTEKEKSITTSTTAKRRGRPAKQV